MFVYLIFWSLDFVPCYCWVGLVDLCYDGFGLICCVFIVLVGFSSVCLGLLRFVLGVLL